jgi:transcriptional regulator GlxA family with amidase domain
VTTGIEMALAMIAKDIDASVAGEVAKRLILYARRPGYQSQFSPVLQARVKGSSPFADLIGRLARGHVAGLPAKPWTLR